MFVVYMLPSVSLGLVLPLAMASGADAHAWLRDGFPLLTMVLTAVGLWYWSKELGMWRNHQWHLGWRAWLGLVVLLILLQAIVYVLAVEKNDITSNDKAIAELFDLFPLWLMVFFVVCVAPVCEEIIFRGMLIGRVFTGRMLWGVAVSTVLFAAIHVPDDVLSWLMYGSLGLAFGLVYWCTKKLWPCVILHMANNLIAVADMQSWFW